ncbi:MAG TPA: hypothetical protein VD887_06585 [Allosphingosinicella sp.]|nr:hypothetical protein [Allosphingosinicella sp.]
MNDDDLIRAAAIIAGCGDVGDEEQAERLVAAGFEESVAYRLVAFLPSAFARPVLEELGVTEFGGASVVDEDGRWISVWLEDQPEYCAALALAREHRRVGIIPREIYEAIVYGTSEIDALSNALNDGLKVDGSTLAIALNSPSHARHVVRDASRSESGERGAWHEGGGWAAMRARLQALSGWLKKLRASPPPPEARWVVALDAESIRVTDDSGETRAVAKAELCGVAIETNGSGPWGADMWWQLFAADGRLACAFPQDATGGQAAIDDLARLPGFDQDEMIRAMRSADDAVFQVWRREH